MYKVQREGRLLKREEGQGTLFINRIGGEKGSVSQLWLKMHCYEGGDGRAKGLFTSFFHLLDLEGERKGMEQACTRGRAASPCALCVSITLTWRTCGPLPYSPVCARPQPAPSHHRPSSRDSQRNAAQPSRLEGQDAASQLPVPTGRAWPSCGSGQRQQQQWLQGELRAQVTAGVRVGWWASGRVQQLGQGV